MVLVGCLGCVACESICKSRVELPGDPLNSLVTHFGTLFNTTLKRLHETSCWSPWRDAETELGVLGI